MQLVSHRIGRTFALSPLVDVLSSARTAWPALRLAYTTLRYFFYPQFETRFYPRKRPVVAVDHPLDASVPFKPGLVGEYLTFFFLWINTGTYVSRAFGKAGRESFRDYILKMTALYRDCAKVYLRCQSTTRRPPEPANGLFSVIHGLDPHLHCVPSLHVLIVYLNMILGEAAIRRLSGGRPSPSQAKAIAYIRQEAIRVTESVLFVKQHSVNCIAISAFCLRAWYPDVGEAGALELIDSLFTYETLDTLAAGAIRAHVKGLYRRLWEDYGRLRRWRPVVLSYLRAFEPEAPWKRAPGRGFVIP
jgi:hypothetical protein